MGAADPPGGRPGPHPPLLSAATVPAQCGTQTLARVLPAPTSLQLFEGMKAFKGKDQQVRLFRPWLNMERMLRSARRLCLPSFDKAELLECIRRLIRVDKDWVPEGSGTSLYVRPVLIGNEPSLGVGGATQALLFVILCPVGSYFPGDAVTPVSLLADPTFIRAWMGGVGDYKLGGNYGPTVYVQREAQKRGCEQVLWLYGPDHQLTEVGTMNIFIYWTHEDGALELGSGAGVPVGVGVHLCLAAQGEFRVAERAITMKELLRALEEGRVREVFGSGTACQVCPVHQILYEGQAVHIPTMEHGPELILRFQKELQAIQVRPGARHDGRAPLSNPRSRSRFRPSPRGLRGQLAAFQSPGRGFAEKSPFP
uniref:Branched-chain-amino-acid aminotransferase, mitochondrial n=1 Tax=Oryctolagus cuniculus TaxID=9986 RepID=G1U0T4_RABIT